MAKIPTVKLSSGHDMPVVGLGVWRAEKGKLSSLVKEAIKIGYRHFDCAGEPWPHAGATLSPYAAPPGPNFDFPS